MISIKKKILSILILILLEIIISTKVQAKYVFDNEFEVANLNIDRMKPEITILDIKNTNSDYKNYASKTHTIEITTKFTDKNLDKVLCDKEHIKFKLGDNYIEVSSVRFEKISDKNEEKIYRIILNNIIGNGKLKIEFISGTAIDKSKLENDKKEIDTNIIIDNIFPTGNFTENKISDGKVKVTINTSEAIRKIDGWTASNDNKKIEKEFTNNISYELPITDYAGNKSIVKIDVVKATYINLVYASHNSEIGWTFGYGNYDIAGKTAVQTNRIYKTEAIAFSFNGNVPNDFIQANAYVYTHWGEGTYGRSLEGFVYKYGYNPDKNTYKSMNSSDLVTIQNKKYFQLGGGEINHRDATDTNGNNPIPVDVAVQFPYGVCGMTLKLKDYTYFSIVYQILVDGKGWISACSDGQECMYSKTKPMSAFRVTLVPKSEKQHVINTWNKDVGTYNLNS